MQEHLISHVLPMIVRAYGDTDARIQEEVLKKSSFLVKKLDAQVSMHCHSFGMYICVCVREFFQFFFIISG